LEVHPKLGGRPEKHTEPQCRIGRDAGLLLGDALDPGAGNAELGRKGIRRQVQGPQEFLAEDFTRMQRGQLDHVRPPSMVVRDFNVAAIFPSTARL
jgi:hypothetical protein